MFIVSFPAKSTARRWPRHWAVAMALCASTLSLGAQAQLTPQALTLDAALRLAEERSRQLVAQDAAASGARDMAVAAGQLPDPVLKAGISNLPVNGSDRFSFTRDFMTMRSIGVMQEFTRADKRQARSARFNREAEAAEAARVVALANLRRDTAMAWLERSFQTRMRDLLQSQRAELTLQAEGADAAYRGSRGTQADVFAARSALAQLDDRILQQDRQIATAQTRLARWIGPGPVQLSGKLPELGTVRLDANQLEAQIEAHPQIALMARQEAVARAEADIAQSNKHSDWTVELMYSQRGQAYSNMVSLNVSIPLQLDQRNRQDRELAVKLATVEQMRAQREEATRESTADALSLLQQWQSNRNRLAQYDSILIPLAADRIRAVLAAYRGGVANLSAALEARRMEIDTRMDRLRLEMETAALWAQLEFLIPVDRPALAGNASTKTVDASEPQQ
ncbi:TolC family protein [Pseudorhodoferax soli]|uniref:Outer membrane protein TolC n=1 Tax=Pseudorhodoferax soli TaxID=545864 RepID=A0A368XJ65_9BURK|nr:TolC family protein [Pseudorhodoferax soli]PZP91285.1 MAG: TolC family protein [Variovorax paradoxus]PZQ01087.1 MAG: TolC family protein [Variovorax paradoxus]RCW66054.1 outer membrane protein TolC [Pseudorhodoferax soli]